ncbi:hypothetical protein MPRS_54700 [Mycobacterium paraseoulense]|nr:hypothetical protein MPRS_54700 [Mycobacterium paraseoulense]
MISASAANTVPGSAFSPPGIGPPPAVDSSPMLCLISCAVGSLTRVRSPSIIGPPCEPHTLFGAIATKCTPSAGRHGPAKASADNTGARAFSGDDCRRPAVARAVMFPTRGFGEPRAG